MARNYQFYSFHVYTRHVRVTDCFKNVQNRLHSSIGMENLKGVRECDFLITLNILA